MKKSLLFLLVVLMAAVVFAGCGSGGSSDSGVVGVYKCKVGEDTLVLALEAGNKGTYSLGEDLEGLPITYKVKGDTVILVDAEGKEIPSGTFKIEDDGLRDFAGNLYEKQ